MAVVAAAVAVIVAGVTVTVVMAGAAAMVAMVYRPLVNTIMVGIKTMNVAVVVVMRLACTYDAGRYVFVSTYGTWW